MKIATAVVKLNGVTLSFNAANDWYPIPDGAAGISPGATVRLIGYCLLEALGDGGDQPRLA